MIQRREMILSGLAATATGIWTPAWAQSFPPSGASLKYVVPFPPGGLSDIMARTVAQKISEAWKVPFVVENKPGANAQIGAEMVAKGPSDGTQLLAVSMPHAANVSLFPDAPYSLSKDLRPVALLAASSILIVVPASSPVSTLKDLMALSKTRVLNAGSSGNGSLPHLAMALFNEMNKSKMSHIPYRGDVPSITDLMGGQLDVVFSNFPASVAHVKGGKLKAIAVCSLGRNALLPDVPTAMESGMPGLFADNWVAAMVNAKTPDAIVEKYSREIIKTMFSPEVESRAKAQGFKVTPLGSAEFGVFLQAEVLRWGRLIRVAKITAA